MNDDTSKDEEAMIDSISVGKDELSDTQLNKLGDRTGADLVVYDYKIGDWSGSGFAVWRIDGKWGYGSLHHCSCRGPLDDLDSIMYDFNELKTIARNYDTNGKVISAVELIEG